MEDHKIYELDGRTIYVIGGANSTDANLSKDYSGSIVDRKIETEIRLRKHRLPKWWEDECVEKKITNLPLKVDMIVSHCAPLNFDPVSIRTSEISVSQFEKIICLVVQLKKLSINCIIKYFLTMELFLYFFKL